VHTITADNGTEFAEHENIAQLLKTKFFFTNTYSAWEKGAIENTNKLVRQYIPKKTNFGTINNQQIKQIQYQMAVVKYCVAKAIDSLPQCICTVSKYLYPALFGRRNPVRKMQRLSIFRSSETTQDNFACTLLTPPKKYCQSTFSACGE
jgi:hypothetical protein